MDLGQGNWRSFLRQLLNYHTWLQPAAAMMIIMMGLQWPINLGRKIYVMLAVGADIVPSAWIIISGGASERMQKNPLCGSYFVGFKIQSANIVQHKTSNINRTPEPSGSYNPPKGKQSSPVSKLQKKRKNQYLFSSFGRPVTTGKQTTTLLLGDSNNFQQQSCKSCRVVELHDCLLALPCALSDLLVPFRRCSRWFGHKQTAFTDFLLRLRYPNCRRDRAILSYVGFKHFVQL